MCVCVCVCVRVNQAKHPMVKQHDISGVRLVLRCAHLVVSGGCCAYGIDNGGGVSYEL